MDGAWFDLWPVDSDRACKLDGETRIQVKSCNREIGLKFHVFVVLFIKNRVSDIELWIPKIWCDLLGSEPIFEKPIFPCFFNSGIGSGPSRMVP